MLTRYDCPVCASTGRIHHVIQFQEEPGVYAVPIGKERAAYAVFQPGRPVEYREAAEGEARRCNRYCPLCHGPGYLPERPVWNVPTQK